MYSLWKEEYCNTNMNMDEGWCKSLCSDWELFGGEIKLGGVNCEFDGAVSADSSDQVGWQTAEDDVLSVCSSATSWSCLHGNSLLETCTGNKFAVVNSGLTILALDFASSLLITLQLYSSNQFSAFLP